MKLLRHAIAAAAVLFYAFFAFPSAAWSWEIKAMNDTVDQTNFIVDSRCSGTLVSLEHRLILTANHCVRHKVTTFTAKKVVDGEVKHVTRQRLLELPVAQKGYDGTRQVSRAEYTTRIVGLSESRDLALVQIITNKIPYSMYSPFLPKEVELNRGDTVWSVGNPALLDASVSRGVISSLTRTFRAPWANNEEIPFVQYDALGAPGSSGGALYSDDGYLIAVVVAGHRGVPIGYAVHPNSIRAFLDETCYPVYPGGELGEHCADFGEVKDPDDDSNEE